MDTTKTLAIIGQSGHGKVIADIAYLNGYSDILWIDDDPSKNLLTLDTYLVQENKLDVAIAIGDNYIREKIFNKLKKHNISMPTLIHPSAVISPSAKISKACVVMPLVIINADAIIKQASIINSGAVIEHDNHIDSFVHISPRVALAGNVTVGTLTHIGIGSSVIQGISISEKSIVAAGSSVIKDITKPSMVAGVPAKMKKELS